MSRITLRQLAAQPRDTIDGLLRADPPPHLFHYTSATGLIGIAKTKQLWASGIQYLNDQKEQQLAEDLVRNMARNLGVHNNQIERDEEDVLACAELPRSMGFARHYVTSFSTHGDQLSQWRAYCPPPGGFAVAIPATHLRVMAARQGFYLAPCVYDHNTQSAIVNELMLRHLNQHHARLDQGMNPEESRKTMGVAFSRNVSRFGPLIKDASFAEEQEWRLVSPAVALGSAQLQYRPGSRGIVPYITFDLVDAANPSLGMAGSKKEDSAGVVIGPTRDPAEAAYAVQSLVETHFGPAGWFDGSRSLVPWAVTLLDRSGTTLLAADLPLLMALGGWSSLAMVSRYSHHRPERGVEVIQRMLAARDEAIRRELPQESPRPIWVARRNA